MMMTSSSLHLIHSDGFLKKYVIGNLVVILMLSIVYTSFREQALDVFEEIKLVLLKYCHSKGMWTLISLLSSSCCIIQIALSSFSFGCAGFNTVLGPARPYILSLVTISQVSVWYVVLESNRPWLFQRTFISSMLTLAITFSPEWLCLYSECVRKRKKKKLKTETTTYRLKFEKIGCMSCVHTIRNVGLESFPGLETNVIDVSKGLVQISVPSKLPQREEFLSAYFKIVSDAGFPAELLM